MGGRPPCIACSCTWLVKRPSTVTPTSLPWGSSLQLPCVPASLSSGAVLCCAMPCHVMLCCAVLWHVLLFGCGSLLLSWTAFLWDQVVVHFPIMLSCMWWCKHNTLNNEISWSC